MTIFMVATYVVKPDKMSEFEAFLKNFEPYIKRRPDLFKEIKSHKIFTILLGGIGGGYVEMWEAESLTDLEKVLNRMMGDKEYQTKVYPMFAAVIVPGTYSTNIWNAVS
jgi:hypothetical protein